MTSYDYLARDRLNSDRVAGIKPGKGIVGEFVKSPFRRRRKRSKKADEQAQKAKLEAKMAVPEWAQEGTGGGGLMKALRGDGEAGAGFGAGIFEDLHAAFSGAKKIQLQEQEAEKLRRVDDHQQAGAGGRPDLDSGRIRIQAARRPEQPEQPADPEADAPAED